MPKAAVAVTRGHRRTVGSPTRRPTTWRDTAAESTRDQLGAGAAAAEGVDAGGPRRGRRCPAVQGRWSGRTRPPPTTGPVEAARPPRASVRAAIASGLTRIRTGARRAFWALSGEDRLAGGGADSGARRPRRPRR